MNHLSTLFTEQPGGILSAHPDDHLIHGNALALLQAADLETHELTLTYGCASTRNYTSKPTFVISGGRIDENKAAAERLGLASSKHLNFPDGFVARHAGRLLPLVCEWVRDHRLGMLLTLGNLADHPDHVAASMIGRNASMQAWRRYQHALNLVEMQTDGNGTFYAPATPDTIAATYEIAAIHASQFLPDDLSSLDQYPIRQDTVYARIPLGTLAARAWCAAQDPTETTSTLY